MKKLIRLFILTIILLTISFNVNARNLTPVEIHGKLNVSGTDIVDKNNNKFQLRGVSSHGVAWFPQYINQDALEYMRDEWGINIFRLAMYSDPSAGFNQSTVEKVKQGVEYAKNAGLYVIIDWHILNDNNPNIHKTEAINFFKNMASLYKDYDNVIYEICNEPNGDTQWSRDVKPYAQDVIKEIRNIDNDAIIIVGTPTWSQDVDIASQDRISGYNNIMYTLHFYAGTHKDDVRAKLERAHSAGLPIFVTEFGMVNADGGGSLNKEEATKWIDLLDKYNISYVIWQLSNKNEGASLIAPNVNKTTGWTYDELAPHGKWFVDNMKRYSKESVQETTTTTTTTTKVTETVNNTTTTTIEVKNKDIKLVNVPPTSKVITVLIISGLLLITIGIVVLIKTKKADR